VETTSKSDAEQAGNRRPRVVVIVRYDDARSGHVAAILRHGGQGNRIQRASAAHDGGNTITLAIDLDS
jgi:hypothetical protein